MVCKRPVSTRDGALFFLLWSHGLVYRCANGRHDVVERLSLFFVELVTDRHLDRVVLGEACVGVVILPEFSFIRTNIRMRVNTGLGLFVRLYEYTG